MIHKSQGLPLGLAASDHLARVHARLEHLQGHRAANGLGLLGYEDDTESAFADLLKDLVGTYDGTRAFADGLLICRGRGVLSEVRGSRQLRCWAIQEVTNPLAGLQQS